MARDCPERRRGQDWRNDDRGGFGNRNAPKIGGTENELDAFMAEMGGGGAPRQAIEYNGGANDNYGGGDEGRNLKPWERGPTGGAAPWARGNRDDRDGGGNAPPPWASGANASGPPGGGSAGYNAAPWANAAPAAPAAAPGSYGYGDYNNYGGYGNAAPGAGAPGAASYGAPGYGAAAPPPPGLGAMFNSYGAGSPPPPPPPAGGAPPPPPPGDAPPPVCLLHSYLR